MPPPSGVQVPKSLDELNTTWLTACLRHARAISADVQVTRFECTRIGEGHGFAGQIARIALRYDVAEEGAPKTLIGKFVTDHAPTREMMGTVDGYVREVRFYRELAPDIGIATPRCYLAHYDAQAGRFCLLLEDMAPASCTDRETGFTVEQTRHVLQALATMHARWWNRTHEVPWLELSVELVERVRDRFLFSLPTFLQRYGAVYPEAANVARYIGVLFQGDEIIRDIRRSPLTLSHNDLHIDNVFLPTDKGGRFALIDWQSVNASRHGVADVARVLSVCLRPELRRAHEAQLLRYYHDALTAQGVRGYRFSTLKFRYRQEVAAMVVVGVMAFDTLDLSVAGGERAAEMLGTRIESAIVDAKVGGLLWAMVLLVRIRRWVMRMLTALRDRIS